METIFYSTQEVETFLKGFEGEELIHLATVEFNGEVEGIIPHFMTVEEYTNYSSNGGMWGYYSSNEWLECPQLRNRY